MGPTRADMRECPKCGKWEWYLNVDAPFCSRECRHEYLGDRPPMTSSEKGFNFYVVITSILAFLYLVHLFNL